MGNQLPTAEQKKIVIVGGSFGGLSLAKQINKNKAFHITLIDRKNYVDNNTSSVRYLVNPEFYGTQIKKLNDVRGVENVKFIQGVLEKVEEKQVICKSPINNEVITIDYDYLVLATGSDYRLFKSNSQTEEERKKEIQEVSNRIEKANHILLVGGRAVAVEILGEILDRYPEKKITLVHSGDRLLDRHNPNAAAKLAVRLSPKKRIQIICNDKVIRPTSENETNYKTSSGKVIENVDFVIWASGYTINTSYLKGSFLESVFTEQGLIEVEPTLQVQGHSNIFAIGDVIELGDVGKLAFNAGQQAKVASKNLSLLVAGKTPLVNYNAQNAAKDGVVVTFGKSYGFFSRKPESVSDGKLSPFLKSFIWNKFQSMY